VAAVHYVLGEAFDRDPFLLFELRGRTREQVLNELSRLRSGGLEEEIEVAAVDAVAAIAVQPGDAADYETPPVPMPALRFSFDAAPVPAAILLSAGRPAAWSLEQSPAEFFSRLYASSAIFARRLAEESEAEKFSTENTESSRFRKEKKT
jgi:uncharacterized Zn finger protein